jgi:hypothetical protein
MSELTINQLVKIIVGIFVFISVVLGVYFIFKDKILNFFETLPTGNSTKFFLSFFKLK